jgi:hypothetical protein
MIYDEQLRQEIANIAATLHEPKWGDSFTKSVDQLMALITREKTSYAKAMVKAFVGIWGVNHTMPEREDYHRILATMFPNAE